MDHFQPDKCGVDIGARGVAWGRWDGQAVSDWNTERSS